MVIEMENPRRPFDRSKAPGPMKKPRLAEEPIRPPNPNNRQFPSQRPLGSVSIPPVSRFRAGGREVESTNGDPSLEAYKPQPVTPHHELVSQYKSALSELTFNSKPIITNLTIIAGENVHAAKAIVATICNNILEVPNDQKLPSLYLLDSIVKNIGRDYIKCFAARLPEVFIKAYRQVDPPTNSSMRHLFGTWKGVFHPQTLQIIEKELGFNSRSDSSSVVATTRVDPSSQRPPHSIHVNPKYLERQRLHQSSKAKGMVTEVPGIIPYTTGDSDRLERASTIAATGDSWVDQSVQSLRRPPRESLSESLYEKNIAAIPGEYDYAPDQLQHSRLGNNKIGARITDEGRDRQWYEGQRHDLNAKGRIANNNKARIPNSDSSVHGRKGIDVSNSWKNSEEEEFMWDMHSRLSETNVTNINLRNEPWMPDDSDRLESENLLLRPTRLQDAALKFESDNLSDSFSIEQSTWISSPKSHDPEDYSSTAVVRKGIQPQAVSSRIRSQGSGIMPQSRSGSDKQPSLHDSASLRSLGKQDFRRTNSLPQRDPRASRLPVKPQSTISRDHPAQCPSSGNQFKDTDMHEIPDSLPVASEALGQSKMSNLLAAVMKSGILSNRPDNNASEEENVPDEEKPRLRSLSAASRPSTVANENLSAQVKVESPSKPLQASVDHEKASDPISSLLNSLVSKGLISASKSELQPSAAVPHNLDHSTNNSVSVSVVSSDSKPAASVNKGRTSAPKAEEESTTIPKTARLEPEYLLGLQFKPDKVREFHPSVISSLFDDLPHHCVSCGIRFKHKEQLESHLKLHDVKVKMVKKSGFWFPKADDWVAGKSAGHHLKPDLTRVESEAEREMEEDYPVVPADESQGACILCGEMFEDYFNVEINQWMFKRAVYLTIPSANIKAKAPILHPNCLAESAMQDLGIVKKENDL